MEKISLIHRERKKLLRRNWLAEMKLDWQQRCKVNSNCTLYDVLDKYSIVFQNELGMVKEVTANVYVNRNATLKF